MLLVIFAVITAVFIFLAVQQARIKRQIEENRRKSEDPLLGDPTLLFPDGGNPLPPGGKIPPAPAPDAPPSSHAPHAPEAGGGHHGGDAGGGFDGGGGHH